MRIVMNELEYAKNIVNERKLGSHPMETMTRVAKYYLYTGNTPAETRVLLDKFVKSCDDAVSVVTWSDRMDSVVKQAQKYPLVNVLRISVTKQELDRIAELEGVQLRRLAFTLLCAAKYYHEINEKNAYWINTPDNEIMKMANINTSIKRQSAMFAALCDAGMIRFSRKVDNLSVQVTFVDEDGECELEVTDMRNTGYQYMKYAGGDYRVCENCGITYRPRTEGNKRRRQKYCDDCAVKVRTRQQVEAVMRRRMDTGVA